MARRRAHALIGVYLNGRTIGRLRRESTGAIDFQYARDWLGWENAFPISLSLPLREDRYVGAPVIAVFDNLLPDKDAIRKRVAERVGAEGDDAFSLLTSIGHDCVGALQFLPEGLDPGAAGAIDGHAVSDEEIAAIIGNLAATPLGIDADADFRISIAGAQEKTALLRHEGKWLRPIGLTATTHIFKPQIGQLPNGIDLSNSVENEYVCLKLLAALGVPTARAEIADFGGRRTLIVERFDRLWTKDGRLLRLPQEDCCQALSVPPGRKYQAEGGPGMLQVLEMLKSSDQPDVDIATFLRASIVFWLLGATDGHAKNFSIFLMPGGRFTLTPLYDMLTAQPSLDAKQIQRKQFKLAMSAGKNRHYAVDEIMPRHFLQTAERAGVGKPIGVSAIEDLAANAVQQTDDVLNALSPGFPEELTSSLSAAMRNRVRLLAESLQRSAARPQIY